MKLAINRRYMKVTLNYRYSSAAIFSLLLCVSTVMNAQESTANGQSVPEATSVTKNRTIKRKPAPEPMVKFDASATAYASASPADNSRVQQVQAELDLKMSGDLSGRFNMLLGSSFSTESSFYYALPEAYLSYGDKYSSISAGRKIENFSAVDRIFNLGLFEGYQTNDMVNFNRSGLVMLSAHYNTGNSGFFLGYSPIFIPNQGPQITAKDGKIISGNRWAASPPKQFKFGDQNKEIIYAVSDFNLTDIILNSGIIANAYFGENRERPTLNLSFAQKPINDLALSRDTFGDISTFQGNVILTPHVLFHEVYAADLNLDFGMLKTTLSYIQDLPTNKTAPELETIQTLEAMQISSLYVGLDLTQMFRRKFETYIAMAQVSGGAIKDITADGQPGSFSFSTSRSQFRRPIRAGAKGDIMQIARRPLAVDLSFTYDQELKGSMVSAKLKYAVNQNLNLNLAADMIGVESEVTDSSQSNFLDQNQANDRISAGVGYAF